MKDLIQQLNAILLQFNPEWFYSIRVEIDTITLQGKYVKELDDYCITNKWERNGKDAPIFIRYTQGNVSIVLCQ